MKKNIAKLNNILFLSGLFLLVLMVTVLVFSSVVFLFNMSISKTLLLISAITSIITYYFICLRKSEFDLLEVIVGNVLAILIFVGATILSLSIYDFAWDSNWYHKTAVGCIKEGWSPLYESFLKFINLQDINVYFVSASRVWAQYYCKASWIIGGNMYLLTDNIETAKVLNLIMVYILFTFSYHYFASSRFKIWQALIISTLLIYNPITCVQTFTLYVDSLLMTTLFSVIIMLFGIIDEKYEMNKTIKYFALGLLIILCVNVKFTGLAYAGIFCFLFFLISLIKAIFDKELTKVLVDNIKYYAVVCSIGILLVGSSTYLANFIKKGHPFYPLAGSEQIDIMKGNQPTSFDDENAIKKVFLSTFSETDNISGDREPKLKPLFSVSENEKEVASVTYDTRIGGFGPLFGGILVVSLIVIVCELVILWKKSKKWFYIILSVIITIFLMLFLITESWWARYSPYYYLIPIIAISLLFVIFNNSKIQLKLSSLIVAIFLTVCLLINASYFAKYIGICKEKTEVAKETLTNLALESKEKSINVSFVHETFGGLEFNLKDYDINYKVATRTWNPGRFFYGDLAKIEE